MSQKYLITDWIITTLVWFIMIPYYLQISMFYHDSSINALSSLLPTDNLISSINNHLPNTLNAITNSNNNDVNVNPQTPQYNLRYAITENQPINFKIGKINDDLIQTPEIRSTRLYNLLQTSKHTNSFYRLREPSNYFDVNETTSILTTKKVIDLETLCPRYCKENTYHAQLNIYVNIWVNYQLICIVNIEITVTDIDDNQPKFPSTVSRPYKLRLKEVIYRIGKSIELPKAIDKDIQPHHAELVYRLDSHPDDKSNALETFRDQHLDMMNIEDRLEIFVEVLNINDIEPTFSKAVYEIQIKEDIPVNSTIYELKATDKDVNSTITYSMENGVDLNTTLKFFIKSNGYVIVQQKLDYEQRNMYSFTVRASDGEFFALARIVITILDVNDEPPEYVLNPQQLTILENKPAQTFIGHLLVVDQDSPEVNGQVHCEEPHHLKGKQPIVFVQESVYSLPRQQSSSLSLSELTSDLDNNNNNNYLPTSLSHLSSSENHVYQRLTLYSLSEFDRENGPDEYKSILYCWDGITSTTFSQAPYDSSIYMDKYAPLNYSKSSTLVSLSQTATMTITLHIVDANDNEPTFEEQFYKAEIKENSPIGTKIIKIHAVDKDVGVNAQIYYSLQENELFVPYFKIDPIMGWIVNSAELDREAQVTFQLTVLAIDGGYDALDTSRSQRSLNHIKNYHTATTQVLINILDENDNPPEFRGPRQFAVEENQAPNTWLGDLQVIDRDEGNNSEVIFKLLNGRMKNNNSIEQTTKRNNENIIHRNSSLYCFEVVVSDKGVERSHSTADTICVRVLDLNDNRPYFIEIKGAEQIDGNKTLLNESLSETTYSTISQVNPIKHNEIKVNYSQYPVVRVSYNEVPGYCALVARAIDEDEGRNAQLRYGITRQYSHINQQGLKNENVLDAFTMDQPSGRVMLTRSLNLNELGSYEMVITVEDNGEPVQRAEKTIQLIIEASSPRGNWLFPEIEQTRDFSIFNSKYTITEANTILIVIILSGISAFLAALLISAILCMIKPCKKSRNPNQLNKNVSKTMNTHNMIVDIGMNKEFNPIICDYDGTDFNLYNHHHQPGNYTSVGTIDNFYGPLYPSIGQHYHEGLPMTNSDKLTVSTCINNVNGVEQDLGIIRTNGKTLCAQKSSSPVNVMLSTSPQPQLSYLHLEYPNIDCHKTVSNISSYNITSRCSTYSPQPFNSYCPTFQPTTMPTASHTLVSSNDPNLRSDCVVLQCTKTPPPSAYYYQQNRTDSLSSNPLYNTSTIFDFGPASLMRPSYTNQNIPVIGECIVKDPRIHNSIIGEEQRSDSGRGASDEENSNQIQLVNTLPTTTSLSSGNEKQLDETTLDTPVNQSKKSQNFRSSTLKYSIDNSSHITTGLVFPSLPRINTFYLDIYSYLYHLVESKTE
ncbi:putative cadherin [Schistosoma mansoni]|uniref:putative cadherin n=1 Tax=Schistosoma mansoni TaxID=6183 RepID=UPI00022DC179|nr:putative cadherin [Schistosoma mansoni]|eukprot:XP_018650518.1 putative cadherin [Schistosoma mansoni]